MNPRRYAWLLIGCLMLSAACSSTKDDRLDSSVEQLNITTAPPAPTSSSAAPNCKSDYLASLSPEGPLPPPNNISADSFMDVIKKRKYLIVGVDKNTKLLGYYNPSTGQFEGFDIDIAREIAKAIFGPDLRDRIHYRALLTNERISAVRDKTVDIVADAFTINCARTKAVMFSNVYFMAHQRILVRADSQAKGPSDFRRKKVCATTGSTALGNEATRRCPLPVPRPHRLPGRATARRRRRHSDRRFHPVRISGPGPAHSTARRQHHKRAVRPGHCQESSGVRAVCQRGTRADAQQWAMDRDLEPMVRERSRAGQDARPAARVLHGRPATRVLQEPDGLRAT